MTLTSNPKPHWAIIHPFQLRLQRGIESYVWGLSTALARSGVDVDIITWNGALPIPEEVKNAGVRILVKPKFRYYEGFFASFFYISKLLRNHYDHVFVHFAGYGEGRALRVIRWFKKQSFSVVFHFPPSLVPHRYAEFHHWQYDKDAEHLIGVSQATASEVEVWCRRKVEVIGHGIDAEKFQPSPVMREQIRQELGISKTAPVLISLAAMEERKGMQWVIKAMPELLKHFPDLQYILVGDGDYRQSLMEQVSDLSLESHVHFIGFKQDVQPYLCAADIVMVLAKGEASSISLLEALSCSLPAITSNRPPFDELINGDFGIKVDEENTKEVATSILNRLTETERLHSMGKAARAWVIEHHNWDEVASKYRDLVKK